MTENAESQQELTPAEVLQAAVDGFNEINKGAVAGMPQVQLDPRSEIEAAQNALVVLLIEKGVIDAQDFIDRKQLAWAEIIRTATEMAKEQKRSVLGQMLAARPGEFPGRN